jgi:predicted nuclease with TOPRIM domain
MAKARNGRNGTLQDALAQLVQNQAALVAQHTKFVEHLDEDRQRFARIERDLELIKALLIKHEEMLKKLPDAIEMLEKLPDAIKEKIGFKP